MDDVVAQLVSRVKSGQRWERRSADGNTVIRLTATNGTHEDTAVTAAQEAEFLTAVGGSVRISLPKK
jgi:hypothetical protein